MGSTTNFYHFRQLLADQLTALTTFSIFSSSFSLSKRYLKRFPKRKQ